MTEKEKDVFQNRRGFLRTLTLGAALFTVAGAFADEFVRTPPQTEGPFYPDRLPLDTDNDLLIINDGITPAVGKITHLSGCTPHIHVAVKTKGHNAFTTDFAPVKSSRIGELAARFDIVLGFMPEV
jgi:hypothetical protein